MGVSAMLVFMTIYVITVIGVFACILQMRTADGMVERIDDLAGLSKTNSGLAIALTIFMVSLIGIPPLAGFFGKWYGFGAAMEAGLWPLVIIALIASVVGAFYYLRIMSVIWISESDTEFVEAPRTLSTICVIAAALVIPLMVVPFVSFPGLELINTAAASLFN